MISAAVRAFSPTTFGGIGDRFVTVSTRTFTNAVESLVSNQSLRRDTVYEIGGATARIFLVIN
jgi:hypothetical protein